MTGSEGDNDNGRGDGQSINNTSGHLQDHENIFV